MSFSRGKKRSVEAWTLDGEYKGKYDSLTEAAKECNVSLSSVSYVLAGKRNSANGYVFRERNFEW